MNKTIKSVFICVHLRQSVVYEYNILACSALAYNTRTPNQMKR